MIVTEALDIAGDAVADATDTLGDAMAEAPAVSTSGEFDDPARYDLEYGHAGADVPFYRGLAERSGGSVLDLATGTGRVALALARDGHAVTAVDISPAMLAHAAAKPGAEDVEWVEQDARSLKLRRRFDLVTLAGNAFQQLLTNDDRDAVLRAVYRQLLPGGTFAFALRFPQPAELARRVDLPELWHTYLDAQGRQVVVSGTQHYHPVAQAMHHETYRHFAVDGAPAATPTSITLRYHFPQELEAALAARRFEVEGRYGDFDRSPLGEGALSMVYVCRKPEATRRSA